MLEMPNDKRQIVFHTSFIHYTSKKLKYQAKLRKNWEISSLAAVYFISSIFHAFFRSVYIRLSPVIAEDFVGFIAEGGNNTL